MAVQAAVRGRVQRRAFLRARAAATAVQCAVRGWVVRRALAAAAAAAVVLQAGAYTRFTLELNLSNSRTHS